MANGKRRGGEMCAIFRHNFGMMADAYGEALKLSPAEVSKRLFGRTDTLGKFRSGKTSISLVQADKVLKYFRDHWPASAQWPFCRSIMMEQFSKYD